MLPTGPRDTSELRRIINLPKRDAHALGARLARSLTQRLKTPHGLQTLRPEQAVALAELHDLRGVLVGLAVGEGKTLISYLAPIVTAAKRPFLLVPGKLYNKTKREFAELSAHWQTIGTYRVMSYEYVSRNSDALTSYDPDLIVADECQALKNPKAAVTRRLWKFLKIKNATAQNCRLAFLSGTLTTRSIRDYWHLSQWALPNDLQILPKTYNEVTIWAETLDAKVVKRRPLGALSTTFGPTLTEAREGYGRRLSTAPGVILSPPGAGCTASIYFDIVKKEPPAEIVRALEKLRTRWETPDGKPFCEAVDLWRHARELANGFYYRWTYRPPTGWLDKRRALYAEIRGLIKGKIKIDSLAEALKARPDLAERRDELDARFRPKTEPYWIDTSIADHAVQWAADNIGLVWTEHKAVGEALDRLGLPYFGAKGLDAHGRSILDHSGPAAVSVAACSEGFNLQKWAKNLILNCPPVGARYEQLMGRTHRFGQEADAVEFEQWIYCDEQSYGLIQARTDARYIAQMTGQKQKLNIADFSETKG